MRIARAGALALLVSVSVVFAVPASSAAPARPSTDTSMSVYDRALVAHTSLEPKLRGEALEAGATVTFDAAGVASYVDAPATAVAADAQATPGVTQNGVCNDLKPLAQVGDQRTFWVHNFKLNQDIQKRFVLAAIAPHSYVWVDATQYDPTSALSTGPITSQGEAQAAANAFESTYNTDRAYFGEPARCDQLPYRQPPRLEDLWGGPWYDADDDPHINIVNFDPDAGATVVAGYYSSADEYPVGANAHSNEGEFFYMNSLLFDPGQPTYNSILAHEFYHMIQFANDANEATWINEGMADVAIEVNGFASLTSSHTSDYANNAGDQLTYWDSELYDYGNAYAFFSYLLEHYGPPDDPSTPVLEQYGLADDITKVAADGFDGLDEILASNPYAGGLDPYYQGRTANDVYLDRAVANIVNDRSIDVGQWGYGTLSSFRIDPESETGAYPASDDVAGAHVYGDRIYAFDSLGDGTFTATSSADVPVIANTPPSGTHELWSGRGDENESWAVREADLTGATSPTLSFEYWYDIEVDYDYAYLQVSEDGGTTWTNLSCCGASLTNPNGNNRGNGWTGISTNTPLDTSAQYVHADVDLSAYAGKVVQVRWLYVTDPAVNNAGLTIDDVSLTDGGSAVWPLETFENGPGAFTLGGTSTTFQVVEPDIANSLSVQLVELGPTVTVERPALVSTAGGVSVSGTMSAPRTIAIVSSLTPITSETFDFSYRAEASPIEDLTPPTLYDPGDTFKRNQRYTLRWSPAGNAGSQAPTGYRVEEATVASTLVTDDAETGLGKWTTTTAGTGAQAWQTSGTKVHGGSKAFWATSLEGTTNTSATMTLAQPLQIPASSTTKLTFWDWYVNEGDDQGRVEVSADGGSTWKAVYTVGRSELAPDGAAALADEPMSLQTVDLSTYAGKTIRLRFVFAAGPDNRAGSTPFGWYVDDVSVSGANWKTIATATGTSLSLSKKVAGTFFYRVTAVYSPSLEGPPSNTVDVTVSTRR